MVALVAGGCAGAETSVEGDVIYANNCARCHRADLSGGVGPALGAGSQAAAKDDSAYRLAIRNGPGSMPSYDGFSDEQVAAVIAFIRSQQ